MRRRLPPDGPGWIITILLSNDGGNIARHEAQLRHKQGIENDPHAVILLPEHHRIPDPFDPLQVIDQPERRVVREKDGVVQGIGRLQHDHRDEVRGHLLHGHTLPDDFRRQLRLGKLLAILGLDLGDVRIGADLERQFNGHMPVVAAGGVEIQ